MRSNRAMGPVDDERCSCFDLTMNELAAPSKTQSLPKTQSLANTQGGARSQSRARPNGGQDARLGRPTKAGRNERPARRPYGLATWTAPTLLRKPAPEP